MALTNPNFYNRSSAKLLGWDPGWFGCDDFDDCLFKAIKAFQTKNSLKPDGLCGESTFKVIFNDRQHQLEAWQASVAKNELNLPKNENMIVDDVNSFKIEWHKFIPLHQRTINLPFRSREGINPSLFVVHWDGCLSAKNCAQVLERRGLSVQFTIDNDGTIAQLVDLKHSAQHVSSLNKYSVGVEISNAVFPKYNSYYKSKGLGLRPIIDKKYTTVHGRNLGNILGFYPVQIEALKALIKSVCSNLKIPLVAPVDKDGNMITELYKPALDKKFSGVISHFHVDKGKEDCIGLDLPELLAVVV